MNNRDVINVLREMADLLQIVGADTFRVRSFQRAVDTVRGLSEDINDVYERGELEALPGIGKSIAAHIRELAETGQVADHQRLKGEVPEGVLQMLEVPDLGPKTAKKLYEELGLESIDDIERAAREEKIRALSGFGAKSEQKLLHNIAQWRQGRERVLSAHALRVAEPLVEALQNVESVERVSLAGSLRRGRDTTKDVDLLVAVSDDGRAVREAFKTNEAVVEVSAEGDTKVSARLTGGLGADLRVVPPASWGAALVYFTGSKAHNINLRGRARDQGLTVNEYGVFPIDTDPADVRDPANAVAAGSEEEVYAALGLPWIAPELREDRGEIDAALRGELPELIGVEAIKGDLHNHSRWSDGQNSILEMAQAARALGYEYLAICDHSRSLVVANGLDEKRVRAQAEEIAEAQEQVPEVRLLRGTEVDILGEGELDLDLDLLADLDVVVASVHSRFNLDEAAMTERVVKALSSGVVDILGHPTGRLINRREGYALDLDAVIDAAIEYGVALEINASPERLDLDEVMARRARQRGALLSINTDAHATGHLDNLRYGVLQARRGWLTARDVINTMALDDLLNWLKD